MRLCILPLALLLGFSAVAQDTTNKWTLRKAVDYAVMKNLTVHQADIQRMYAETDLHQANMAKLPTLNGNVFGGFRYGLSENPATGTLQSNNFFSSQAGLQSNYTIFNWFVRRNNIEAGKLGVAASKAGIEKAQNDISLSVANTFLQAMLGMETIRLAELQLGQTYAQLTNTNALVRAGTLPEINSLQLQAQVASDSANLIQAESSYRQALIQLRALLNLPQDTAFEIVIPPVDLIPIESLADLEPSYVYQQALTNQPQQKLNELRLQQANFQAKAARGAMYPSFFAQGGLNTSYVNIAETPIFQDVTNLPTPNFVTIGGTSYFVTVPQARIVTGTTRTPFGKQVNNNFGQSIGVGISFSIFNQHQARTQWNRAKIQVSQYRIQQEQDNATLQSDIFNAYELAVAALQKFNASERQVEVNEQALDLANKRYSLGLMNVLDLIITQNNLQRARLESVRNKYDYVFKMKVLEFYKGMGIRL